MSSNDPNAIDPRRKVKPIESFGDGRICAEEGCETILSRYNPDERCKPHQFYFNWNNNKRLRMKRGKGKR